MWPSKSKPLPFPEKRVSRVDPNLPINFIDGTAPEAMERVWRMPELRTEILSHLSRRNCVQAMPTCRAWLWPVARNLYHSIPLFAYEGICSKQCEYYEDPSPLRKMIRSHVMKIDQGEARRIALLGIPSIFPNFTHITLAKRYDGAALATLNRGNNLPNLPNTFPRLLFDQELMTVCRDDEPIFKLELRDIPKEWSIQPQYSLMVRDYGTLCEYFGEGYTEWYKRLRMTGNRERGLRERNHRWLRQRAEVWEADGQYHGEPELVEDLRARKGVFKERLSSLIIAAPLSSRQLVTALSGAQDDQHYSRLTVVCNDWDFEDICDIDREVWSHVDELTICHPRTSDLAISVEDSLNTFDWSAIRSKSLGFDVTHPAFLYPRQSTSPIRIFEGPPLDLHKLTITFHVPKRLPQSAEIETCHAHPEPSSTVLVMEMTDVEHIAEAPSRYRRSVLQIYLGNR